MSTVIINELNIVDKDTKEIKATFKSSEITVNTIGPNTEGNIVLDASDLDAYNKQEVNELINSNIEMANLNAIDIISLSPYKITSGDIFYMQGWKQIEDRVFFAGGGSLKFQSRELKYGGETDLPELLISSTASMLAYDGRYLYNTGGYNSSNWAAYAHFSRFDLQAYDNGETVDWESLGATPFVGTANYVHYNGKLYGMCGSTGVYSTYTLLDSIQVYNTVTNSWSTIPIPEEYRRNQNTGLILIDDVVYLIGGRLSHFHGLNTVDTYNITTNTWERIITDLGPTQVMTLDAVLVEEKIVLYSYKDNYNNLFFVLIDLEHRNFNILNQIETDLTETRLAYYNTNVITLGGSKDGTKTGELQWFKSKVNAGVAPLKAEDLITADCTLVVEGTNALIPANSLYEATEDTFIKMYIENLTFGYVRKGSTGGGGADLATDAEWLEGTTTIKAPTVKQVTDSIQKVYDVSYIQKVLDWKHFNIRAYGERGTVEAQGFTQDGNIPITYDKDTIDGRLQDVICLPAPVGGGTSLLNSARMSNLFDDSLWDDLDIYGGSYSGVSKLGTENMVSGQAGAFTGVLDRFKDGNPYSRFVIAFKGMPHTDGESYVYVTSTATQHITGNVLLNGENGLPAIKVGEWFEWEVVIPPNYDTTTQLDIFINGVLIPPKLKYFITTFSGLGSALKVGNWFTTLGGNYSYHSNIGVTILQTDTHKIFTNDDVAGSNIYTIVAPEGKFDLTCEASDNIQPLPVGHTLQIVAMNKRGTIHFIGNPNFLINGIKENTLPISKSLTLQGVNISGNSINYSMDVSSLL